jgi:hypothetical protein
LRLFTSVGLALLIALALPHSSFSQSLSGKLYAVIFDVELDPTGKVKELRVAKVIDPSTRTTDAVQVEVPAEYLSAAKVYLSARTYDAIPSHFNTYLFFDPSRPGRADIDPRSGNPVPNATTDQPHAVDQQQLSLTERAIVPYVQTARQSYPAARARFLAGLPSGQTFFVVTRLTDSAGRFEQAFIRVQSIEGTAITGIISSEIALVKGFKEGQSYTFSEAGLIDWVITKPDGSEEGNVVGKFLDTYRP